MENEKKENDGFVKSLAGYLVKPVADQLVKETSDLWDIVSGQEKPAVSRALLKIETLNIDLQREIRDLEYSLNDALEKIQIPKLISNTYFFEDNGPCCTVCFDKRNKIVIMTRKIVNHKKNILISSLIVLAVFTLLLMYSNSIDKTNNWYLYILPALITVYLFIVLNWFYIKKSDKENSIFKKIFHNDIDTLKCGVCKHKVNIKKSVLDHHIDEIKNNKVKSIIQATSKEITNINEKKEKEIANLINRMKNLNKEFKENTQYNRRLEILQDVSYHIDAFNKNVNKYNKVINEVNVEVQKNKSEINTRK